MDFSPKVEENLKTIVTSIKSVMPVSSIYLFGSYAYGTPDEHSDLDIYVVTPDKSKRRVDWAFDANMSFNTKVNFPVDILVNYEDDFENRKKNHVTLEYDVSTKGVNLV